MTPDVDLELVPTEALIAELQRRMSASLIVLCRPSLGCQNRDANEYTTYFSGGTATAIGLARMSARHIIRHNRVEL